jgi:hypothetical protein
MWWPIHPAHVAEGLIIGLRLAALYLLMRKVVAR